MKARDSRERTFDPPLPMSISASKPPPHVRSIPFQFYPRNARNAAAGPRLPTPAPAALPTSTARARSRPRAPSAHAVRAPFTRPTAAHAPTRTRHPPPPPFPSGARVFPRLRNTRASLPLARTLFLNALSDVTLICRARARACAYVMHRRGGSRRIIWITVHAPWTRPRTALSLSSPFSPLLARPFFCWLRCPFFLPPWTVG